MADNPTTEQPTRRELARVFTMPQPPAGLACRIRDCIAQQENRSPSRAIFAGHIRGIVAAILLTVALLPMNSPPSNALVDLAYEHAMDESDLQGQFTGDLSQWLEMGGAHPPTFGSALVLAKNCFVGPSSAKHLRFAIESVGTINLFIFPAKYDLGDQGYIALTGKKRDVYWRLVVPDRDHRILAFYSSDQARLYTDAIVAALFPGTAGHSFPSLS